MAGAWKEETSSGKAGKDVPQPRSGMAGKITHNIGTGENAKNSIVWMTITWSFGIAGLLSLLLFVVAAICGDLKFIDEVKTVWSIFAPLITLALGYAFGKNK
ncbi:hypothetical protein OP492_00865 [Pseudomonas mosselii]|uniref:hypothetical protein n=1 Tax=Pseudomonas mosselii TaxID=78327 RepID=UPI002B056E6F|nr:hypothetical protein [Pseudomonas mosselii]MEA3233205.1 hypothetical protein [Pseudomonas mosselii]